MTIHALRLANEAMDKIASIDVKKPSGQQDLNVLAKILFGENNNIYPSKFGGWQGMKEHILNKAITDTIKLVESVNNVPAEKCNANERKALEDFLVRIGRNLRLPFSILEMITNAKHTLMTAKKEQMLADLLYK